MARRLIVEIIGDSRSYERALKRSQAAGTQFSTSVGGGLVKGAAAFTGITSAALLASSAVRASAQEFAEHARVTAQTEAVLKSTGGVAHVTADEISRLADEVLRYSGIDDEAVQSAENLLLTFKNVRNEVGANNDIFNRATKAAVDLSVAGFGSLDSTAKQLGKALNDPVRGMTALGRAGVTFTQSQKDTIEALVESGRTLEAQKLILAEVESQVGDSARAYGEELPGKIARAQQSLNNLGGDLAEKFAPAVERGAELVIALVDAIDRLGAAMDKIPGQGLKRRIDEMFDRIPALLKILSPLGPASLLFGTSGGGAQGLLGPQGLGLPAPPGPVGPQRGTGRRGSPSPFQLPMSLRLDQARAEVTAAIADDLAVARRVRAYIQDLIASGKLKGQRLLDALGALAAAQATIVSAQEDAARKQTAAAEKHADAVRRAADRQRQAAEEAAQKIRQATDQARTEIGQLFQGPILAPTAEQRNLALGVPGPDPERILRDIRAQNALALRFERDLRRLGRLGVGAATIDELRGLGTGAIPNIEAILGARGPTRGQLINALLARQRTAQRIGQMIVHTPNVTLHARRVVLAGGGGTRSVQSTARSGRSAGQN